MHRRIAFVQAGRAAGCLSIDDCELLDPDDEAAALGAGAHYLERDRAT